MGIKTIRLSELEANPGETLLECASGQTFVVELPDHRLVAIHPLDPQDDDSLSDELLQSNAAFRELVSRSKSATRKPLRPRP